MFTRTVSQIIYHSRAIYNECFILIIMSILNTVIIILKVTENLTLTEHRTYNSPFYVLVTRSSV